MSRWVKNLSNPLVDRTSAKSRASRELSHSQRISLKQRILYLIVIPAILGVLLVWGCVSLVGLLAVFVSEHRFWGLPVYPVMIAEALLAWVPLCALAGFTLGTLLPNSPFAASFATAVFGFLFLLLTSVELWSGNTLAEAVGTFVYSFLMTGLFMVIATPLGALLAVRRKRPNSLRWFSHR